MQQQEFRFAFLHLGVGALQVEPQRSHLPSDQIHPHGSWHPHKGVQAEGPQGTSPAHKEPVGRVQLWIWIAPL